jgi:hypothetical protein
MEPLVKKVLLSTRLARVYGRPVMALLPGQFSDGTLTMVFPW